MIFIRTPVPPRWKTQPLLPIFELFPAATGRQQLNDTRSWSGSVKHTPGGTAIVVDDCWFLCDLSTRSNALPPSFSNMRRAWQVFIQLRGVTQAWCCVLFFIIWLFIKSVRKITVSERHRWITSFLATGVDGFLSILFKFHFCLDAHSFPNEIKNQKSLTSSSFVNCSYTIR